MTDVLRKFFLLLMAISLAVAIPTDADARTKRKRAAPVNKYAAYVVHAETGDVLFERYADEKRYPASLTKMMTLYVLFEEMEAGRLSPASSLTVSAHAAGQPPSKLGLTAGSTIDADTAIKALVVKSANDAAATIAEAVSGSEWQFAQKMTQKARELGMSRTTFKNASGLPNSRQISTARDLATLGRRLASDFPQYYHYFSTHSFTWNGRKYHGHNSVAETYPGAEGLKTGYTRMSGFNLATSATRDGNRLVAVVMGGKSVRSRDTHMRELLDASYSAIAGNPMLIASAPQKPSPRLKPTLLARLEAERATPTIADSDAIRRQLMIAASEFTPAADPASDAISSLIAAANPEELNAAERTRLADVSPMEALWGEGDAEAGPTPNGWSVQIGAYSTKTLAEDELDAAADAVSLTNRIRVIEPMTLADGSELYRARFTMLTAPEATDLCQSLRDKALSCFVIQDGAAGAQ